MSSYKDKKAAPEVLVPTNFVPPNFKRRQLIFDSFLKLKGTTSRPETKGNKSKGQRGVLLYSWGAGYHGQLGLNSNLRKKCVLKPKRLDLNDPVIQVSCGGFHTSCVTSTGQVYTWGDGQYGQLGNLHPKHNMLSTPHIVDYFTVSKQVIQQVACGQYHTAAVSTSGNLFTWGSGKYGQHGHGSRLSERYPKKVEILDPELAALKGRFVQVSCGDRHTAAVMKFNDNAARVVTFGSGTHGQLGHGNTEDCNWPRVLEFLTDQSIISVSCGATHTAGISEDGKLYLWGFGENIHPKPYSNIVDTPRLVKIKGKIRQVALGQNHALALTWDGDVYAWGNAEQGQIGHGSQCSVRKPRLILKNKEIFEIAAGRYHSLAVSGYGIMYSWGCGESGQLAHGSLDSKYFPAIVEAGLNNVIGQISCGEHHSLAITSIPHASVSHDVKTWLEIEHEELKLKNMMLKEFPNGLQSKHVLDIARNRKRLVESLNEQRAKDEEIANRHLKEQLQSIQTREAIVKEVNASLKVTHKRQQPAVAQIISRPQSAAALREANSNTTQSDSTDRKSLTTSKTTANLLTQIDDPDQLENTRQLGPSASQPVLPLSRNNNNGAATDYQHQPPSSRHQNFLSTESRSELELNVRKVHNHNRDHSYMDSARSSVDGDRTERASTALVDLDNQATFYPLAARVQFFERSRVVLERVKTSLQAPAITNNRPQLMKNVFQLKKENNLLLNQKRKKAAKLKKLQREFNLLYLTNDELKVAEGKQARIKDLKMKLVTLNTRLMEAEENKRNYELYILRMKEEDVQLSKQIDEMRQGVMELDRAVKKKAKRNQSVVQSKIQLDEEIVSFNADIDEFSEFAGNQLSKYKRLIVNNISNTKKAEDQLKRQKNIHKKDRDKVFGQMDERRALIDQQETEIKSELRGWQHKVQYYEKRFHTITAATGLTEARDIINKYFFNDDIKVDLEKDIAGKKSVIGDLQTDFDGQKGQLAKHEGDHVWVKWKDVASQHDEEFDATQNTRRKGNNLLKWLQKLTYVQEAVVGMVQDIELVVELPEDTDNVTSDLPSIDMHSAHLSSEMGEWVTALNKRSEQLFQATKDMELQLIEERKQAVKDMHELEMQRKAAAAMFGKLSVSMSTKLSKSEPRRSEARRSLIASPQVETHRELFVKKSEDEQAESKMEEADATEELESKSATAPSASDQEYEEEQETPVEVTA